MSRDGTMAAVACGSSIGLWNLATQSRVTLLRRHRDYVTDLAFSGDGGILISGSVDGTARAWDVARATELASFRGRHRGAVWSVAISPDGCAAMSGSTGGEPLGAIAFGALSQLAQQMGAAYEHLIRTRKANASAG